MNCKEHADRNAIGNCLVCNSPLCKTCVANNNLASPQCINCYSIDSLSEDGVSQAMKKNKKREEITKQREVSEQGKTEQKFKSKLFLIVVGIVIIIIQFTLLNREYEYTPTDKSDVIGITDYCLLNLIETSEAFEQGLVPDIKHKCPLTDSPYIVSKHNGNLTVSDPNPELHGFIEMSVSQDNPELLLIEDPNASDRDDQL